MWKESICLWIGGGWFISMAEYIAVMAWPNNSGSSPSWLDAPCVLPRAYQPEFWWWIRDRAKELPQNLVLPWAPEQRNWIWNIFISSLICGWTEAELCRRCLKLSPISLYPSLCWGQVLVGHPGLFARRNLWNFLLDRMISVRSEWVLWELQTGMSESLESIFTFVCNSRSHGVMWECPLYLDLPESHLSHWGSLLGKGFSR